MRRRSGGAAASGKGFTSRLLSHLGVLALLGAIVVVGVWGPHLTPAVVETVGQGVTPTPETEATTETVTFTLYFAAKDASRLLPEVREVVRDPEAGAPFQAMVELAKGPSRASDLFATIPPQARVIAVEISGAVANVDWNQAFVDEHWGGSTGEWLTIRSIIRTLGQFPEIERVQLLVGGEPIETLAGHFKLDHPVPTGARVSDVQVGAAGADAEDGSAADAGEGSAEP